MKNLAGECLRETAGPESYRAPLAVPFSAQDSQIVLTAGRTPAFHLLWILTAGCIQVSVEDPEQASEYSWSASRPSRLASPGLWARRALAHVSPPCRL